MHNLIEEALRLAAVLRREQRFSWMVDNPHQYTDTEHRWYYPSGKEQWLVLGAGHFSMVLEHEDYPDLVVKVGIRQFDAGLAYAAWARANPGQHIPKIIDIHSEGGWYYVVMPRYEDMHEEQEIMHSVMSAVLEDGCAPDEYVSTPEYSGALAAEAIRDFFRDTADFDLHSGNVMVDTQTGELIITDPVSYTRGELRHEQQGQAASAVPEESEKPVCIADETPWVGWAKRWRVLKWWGALVVGKGNAAVEVRHGRAECEPHPEAECNCEAAKWCAASPTAIRAGCTRRANQQALARRQVLPARYACAD